MARFDTPKIYRIAVFAVEIRDGKRKYIRKPYDIVRVNYGDGTDVGETNLKTDGSQQTVSYIQPDGGRLSRSATEELYDEIMYFEGAVPGDPMGPHSPNP